MSIENSKNDNIEYLLKEMIEVDKEGGMLVPEHLEEALLNFEGPVQITSDVELAESSNLVVEYIEDN